MGHIPPNFTYRLSKLLDFPFQHENIRFWTAWMKAEGGTAEWNPANSTYLLPFGESWSYNDSSVQNYWRPVAGICATALTIIQKEYLPLLGDLQSGKYTAEELVERNRVPLGTWGTNPDTMLGVLKTL